MPFYKSQQALQNQICLMFTTRELLDVLDTCKDMPLIVQRKAFSCRKVVGTISKQPKYFSSEYHRIK